MAFSLSEHLFATLPGYLAGGGGAGIVDSGQNGITMKW